MASLPTARWAHIDPKIIDTKTQHIVFGFIRRCEMLLPARTENVYYTIPDLVCYSCLLFYYETDFYLFTNAPSIRVGQDRLGAKVTRRVVNGENNYVFGTTLIDKVRANCVVSWEFEIISRKMDKLQIGIESTNDQHDFMVLSYRISQQHTLKEHDIVEVVFSVKQRTLECFVNGKPSPFGTCKHERIPFADDYASLSYQLYIRMWGEGSKLQLVKFQQRL